MTNPVIDQLLVSYRFNLRYARQLVEGVSRELLYRSFGEGIENHPGFTLGHLSVAAALTVEDLGGLYDVPAGWDELFRRTGPGDPRRSCEHTEGVPTKEMLLSELSRLHSDVEARLIGLTNEDWSKPTQWRLSEYYPTQGDLLTFMCITHEAMHLGQVAAWRRAAGLDSALAAL